MTRLALVVLLAAELPDAGSPTFPGYCAGYGGFIGGAVAWLRGRPSGPLATRGSILGFGLGLFAWIATLAIDRL